MKMTTEVPEGVATPDLVVTSLGVLTSFDGVPDDRTTQVVFDNLDLQRAVQAYLSTIQVSSLAAMRKGYLGFGPTNTTVMQFEELMDSKALWLTPNTVSVYQACWLELGDEPMVIETPPSVLGFIDDAWFQYVVDFGNAGPDRGQGGKFLILPPGYDGEVPDGYHVARSQTHGNWVAWRGFQVDGSTGPAIDATKEQFRIYPLSQKDNPPKMNFIQGRYDFLMDGARLLDSRIYMHFYATGITPAMAIRNVGKGSQYAIAYLDSEKRQLDGGKTYRIHLPPNVPAKDFWSFTLYDNQTRSMLQTDQRFPGLDNNQEGLKQNPDGSYDIYFGPEPPTGWENNWLQTVPGKGWNTIFRLYGPLESFYDQTWKPGDPELVE